MLKIAICEDNPAELNEVTGLLSLYGEEHAKNARACGDSPIPDFEIHAYSSAEELLKAAEMAGFFQLYILDILMPGQNGMELAKKVRQSDADADILFLTSSTDYAVESYSVHAFSYLLKPIDKARLFSCMDQLFAARRTEAPEKIPVKTKQGIVPLPYRNILYVEYQAHYLYYSVVSGEVIKSTAIKVPFSEAIRPLLQDCRFIKISSAYAVNMDYVKVLTSKAFEMENRHILSISRNSYKEIKRHYIDYILGKGRRR